MKGEAAIVMATAPSLSAAAKRLNVDRSTLFRWIREGKVPPLARTQAPGPPASPLAWAAAVKAAYELSATEAALVGLAEAALALANDVTLTPMARLQAMARFAALVKQVNLEVPADGKAPSAIPAIRPNNPFMRLA
jgi:transposase-like protein